MKLNRKNLIGWLKGMGAFSALIAIVFGIIALSFWGMQFIFLFIGTHIKILTIIFCLWVFGYMGWEAGKNNGWIE